MTRILVLNAGYEPLQLVSWQRGLCLVLSNKAEVVERSRAVARSVSCTIELPCVVRLVRYVHNVSKMGMVRCSRRNILLRDRFQCQYCGIRCKPAHATVDHIVPRVMGGKTTWTNAVAACNNCNRKKGSRSLDSSGLKLMRAPRRPTWNDLFVVPKETHGELLAGPGLGVDLQPGTVDTNHEARVQSVQEIGFREVWLKYLS